MKQDILKKSLQKGLPTIYARLKDQFKFKYLIIFSASFHKTHEEDQRSDEIELFINLHNHDFLTESHIYNIDVKSQLEHQIRI